MANSGSFDVVTVGGGLAASALAIRMARGGARVLVLEKETKFRDRVRGEGLVPWGVTEARKLGIIELLMQSCAKEVPWVEMGFGPRNLLETTVPKEPLLAYCHPEMQEVLLAEAENSGAEVRRGVTVENVEPRTVRKAEPTVAVRNGTSDQPTERCNEKTERPMEKIGARLVVGVDGRNSMVRKWAGFAVERKPVGFQFAGVQLAGVRWREDLAPFIFNPDLGMAVAMVPQTKGRWRSYLGYPTAGSGGANRVNLQGENKLRTFVAESARAVPQMVDAYANVECIGPLASFDVSESWVAHPYRDGVALLGDAAATSDPTFGQGMATALRSVRVLSDALLCNSNWDQVGNEYALQHDRAFQNTHKVCGWMRTLMQDPSSESAALRQRAMPKIVEDVTRVPDHVFSGPDLPADESVRARFFGEN